MTNDYECIIRHFFPRLELLVVLINDGIITMKHRTTILKRMKGIRESSSHGVNSQKSAQGHLLLFQKGIWFMRRMSRER
jgi:hypothetical protein